MLINLHEGGAGTSSKRISQLLNDDKDEGGIEKGDNGDVDVPPPAYEPVEELPGARSSRRQSRRKSSRRGEGGLWITR